MMTVHTLTHTHDLSLSLSHSLTGHYLIVSQRHTNTNDLTITAITTINNEQQGIFPIEAAMKKETDRTMTMDTFVNDHAYADDDDNEKKKKKKKRQKQYLTESNTNHGVPIRRIVWRLIEWAVLAVLVSIYLDYLESTVELPSDNESLLFGQHRLYDPEKRKQQRQRRSIHSSSHNQKAQLTLSIHSTNARLGNEMFQYASVFGIYQGLATKNKNLCIHPDFDLSFLPDAVVGPLAPMCTKEEIDTSVVAEIPDMKYGTFYEPPLPACEGDKCTYDMKGYYQSYKYFQGCCENAVRSLFAFKPEIQQEADEFLRSVATPIKIGIHVRRGDMNRKGFYLRDPPLSYYEKAMDHFADQYGAMEFVVASDDPDWTAQQDLFAQSSKHSVRILKDHNGPVDLAILASCQHVITSRGSFGWWAAWLSGGSAVYYRDAFDLEHPENKGRVVLEDHYPPDWIAMA